MPLEERWEALEEAERIATAAESRVEGGHVGLARTADGLELLRATGLPDADIANWRYGRRLQQRRSLLWWIAGASMVLAVARVAEAERKLDPKAHKARRKRGGRRRTSTEPAAAPVRPLRPWERLAVRDLGRPLLAQNPE